jgi:membrane dipeptidase
MRACFLMLALAACGQTATPDGAPAASVSIAAVAPSSVPSASASASVAATPLPPPVVIADKGPFDVIDLHVDTPWKVHFKGRKVTLREGHATPDLLRKGSYAAIIFPIYIPDYADKHHPKISTADGIFDTIDKIVAAHEDTFVSVIADKKPRAVPDDKVAVFVSIEGAGAFAADITQIDRFIARGVRLIGPVHIHDDDLAAAATFGDDFGLTDLGKQFCERVYKAGALVDVSHMSDKAFDDLVPIAKRFNAPIVATHSNARVVQKVARNLTDEQLRIIGQTGGVAGLNLHSQYVHSGKAKMSHVVEQVKHMVEVAGIDHVAIGSDFDGGNPVRDLRDAGRMQDLAKALVEAGLTDADVRKIFGSNALRVLTWGLTP